MPYIPYHSGLPKGDPSMPAWLEEAARVEPPTTEDAAALDIPLDRLLAGEALLAPRAAPTLPIAERLGEDPGGFWVHLTTDTWRPNHQVTVRTEQDGWDRDIFGKYRFGAWHFRFEKAAYPGGLVLRFVLNRSVLMQGDDLTLSRDQSHTFDDRVIRFQAEPDARFRHGLDDFVCHAAPREEEQVPFNTDETREYDVIVIGSGMSGGILADQLSDQNHNVLVLEAGGLELPSHIDNLPGDRDKLPFIYQSLIFDRAPGSEFILGTQFALGGRSLFWSGLIPRMYDWELAFWPRAVADHLASPNGYERAERLLRLGRTSGPFQRQVIERLARRLTDFTVRDLPRSRDQARVSAVGAAMDVPDEDVGTFSTADLLLGSLAYKGPAGSDNLTINLHHLVTSLEIENDGVKTVVCQDLAGNRERRYRGRIVVLAAGSIQSPKIALESGLQERDRSGRIGRGLTDHPAFFSSEYEVPEGFLLDEPEKHAKILLSPNDGSANHRPYHVEFLVNPWYWNTRFTDPELRRQQVGQNQRAKVRMTFTFDAPLEDTNVIKVNGAGKKVTVDVRPNQRGRQFEEETKQTRNRILEAVGLRELDPGRGMGYGNEGTPHHAGGSLRMANDANAGVVNADQRFWGYENLYCADVSVFPRIPVANPVLTLVALTQRLADHLHARL